MNKKRLIVLIILAIFCVGMVMGTASASHTFKDKGYKYKMSTKEVNKLKKYAKKYVRGYKYKKVSKITYMDTMEKFKVGKTYKLYGGKKIKILKLVKTYKGSPYGGGGYKYKVKNYAYMTCGVEYDNREYYYYATAFNKVN